ncbi:hypothetical protein HJC23_006311 [Cyclotella cryptica]|uniref:Uncharacterized protein n=1 Tax=Cyclotella cryptica TaxID=29204 RepID=A0ABD3P7I2_9STRA|eukprot:CCRYP_016829-RA/>CCRYP_016829-RA protein AED:0.13 eAED:-0.15 QI:0/0/0/1/1/0.66/3/0/156
MSEETFKHGDGCCACNCTDGKIGTGGCLFTLCCPCFAFCKAADEAKLNHGTMYCVMTVCGFGCCALMMLGQDIEDKRNLKKHGGGWVSETRFRRIQMYLFFLLNIFTSYLGLLQHCINSCFNGCTCHLCRVVNECKVYANEGALGGAPAAVEMERK